MPLDFDQDCRCPSCLQAALRERIARFVATVTPQNATEVARSLAAQGASAGQPTEGFDYELDARGNLVFTKWFLLRRGACCESGCRNCPYGFRG